MLPSVRASAGGFLGEPGHWYLTAYQLTRSCRRQDGRSACRGVPVSVNACGLSYLAEIARMYVRQAFDGRTDDRASDFGATA